MFAETYPSTKCTSGDTYRIYTAICQFRQTPVVTPRRVADLIKELEYYQVITTTLTSRGRHGRTKEIALAFDTDKIRKLLQPVIDPDNLINAKMFCQGALYAKPNADESSI